MLNYNTNGNNEDTINVNDASFSFFRTIIAIMVLITLLKKGLTGVDFLLLASVIIIGISMGHVISTSILSRYSRSPVPRLTLNLTYQSSFLRYRWNSSPLMVSSVSNSFGMKERSKCLSIGTRRIQNRVP